MRTTIAFLLAAVMLTACSGAADDSTAETTEAADETTETTDVATDGATEAAADDAILDENGEEITDEQIQAAMEDFLAEFCTNLDSFDAAYGTFQSAEEGSEEEAAAVEEMAQVGTEMEALVGEDLPQLVTALTVLQTAAADYVAGEGSTLAEEEFTSAVDVILGADAACVDAGL